MTLTLHWVIWHTIVHQSPTSIYLPTTTQLLFYGPFSGSTRVSWCQKRTSGLYGAREIYRGRHTDHPAGHHFIWTNQCPPPPSPIFFTARMPFLPPNQQCQSIEGNLSTHQISLKSEKNFCGRTNHMDRSKFKVT